MKIERDANVAECGCRDPFSEVTDEAPEVPLDVRGLPMHMQIGQTLARMESLPPGQRLRHINDYVPWPLFAMLETRGYRYRLVGSRDGNVVVQIWRLAYPSAGEPKHAA